MKNKNLTVVSIILVLIAVLTGVYFVLSSRIKVNYTPNYALKDGRVPKEKQEINEYKVFNVTLEDMARTYFNSYITLMFEDINEAYNILEDTTQDLYPNVESFKQKANLLTDNFTHYPVFKAYKTETDKDEEVDIYKVKDSNNNIYTFKVKSVMNYKVNLE